MQGADADALAGTDAALMQGAMLTQMQWLIILLMLMLMTGCDAGGVLSTLKSVRPQSFSKRPWPPAIEICAPLTTTNTPRVFQHRETHTVGKSTGKHTAIEICAPLTTTNRVKLDSTHLFKEHQKHAI